jgi:hypothetical protein
MSEKQKKKVKRDLSHTWSMRKDSVKSERSFAKELAKLKNPEWKKGFQYLDLGMQDLIKAELQREKKEKQKPATKPVPRRFRLRGHRE